MPVASPGERAQGALTSPFARGYFGRVIAVGLTAARRPALCHVHTGRGKLSRQRRATVRRLASGQIAVESGPLGPSEGRAAPAAAVLCLLSRPACAVAGAIPNLAELCLALGAGGCLPQALQEALARWGPEPSPYRMPRTAAVLLPSGPLAWLGATAEPEEGEVVPIALAPGRFECLPTASGAAGSTAPIGSDVGAELVGVRLAAQDARGIAEAAYGLFDPELVVSAAAAVWDQQAGAWEIAVRNLHRE